MKVLRLSTLLIGSSLLLPASILAANTVKKSLHLYDQVTVNGTPLAPGDYKVEWNGTGTDVKLDIMKGHETVATVPAKLVSQPESNSQDGYALKPGKDGTQRLAQVFFSGERYELNILPSAPAGSSTSSSTGAN